MYPVKCFSVVFLIFFSAAFYGFPLMQNEVIQNSVLQGYAVLDIVPWLLRHLWHPTLAFFSHYSAFRLRILIFGVSSCKILNKMGAWHLTSSYIQTTEIIFKVYVLLCNSLQEFYYHFKTDFKVTTKLDWDWEDSEFFCISVLV